MNNAKCDLCGESIDLGACDQANTVISIRTSSFDTENCKTIRKRLCDDCTSNLKIWLIKNKL